jgi:peroxin-5
MVVTLVNGLLYSIGWQEDFAKFSDQARLDPQQQASFDTAFRHHMGWSGEFSMQHPQYNQQQNMNGKGRIVELDQQGWEDQFAAFDSQGQEQQHEETEDEIAQRIEEAAAKDPAALQEFESIWQDLRDQMAKGESEVDEGDDWEDEFGNFGPNGTTMYKPDLGDYVFEVENPYLEHANPLAEAMEMLKNQTSGGDTIISLSELALALEAAVQKDPTNSEIWTHLGNIQAQNEKEEPAIRALEKAVDVDPRNYPALMSLAVSYTNESYDHAAYQTLERWITEKYPNVVGPTPLPAPATPYELHERVTDLFLKAAQMAPDGQAMDPDVQVGLGVLFYGGGDLEKAIDCFFAAVKGRPNVRNKK